MRVSRNGDLRSDCDGCSGRYRGAHMYHWLDVAIATAKTINQTKGWKYARVVIMKGHFAVVDHTWERND